MTLIDTEAQAEVTRRSARKKGIASPTIPSTTTRLTPFPRALKQHWNDLSFSIFFYIKLRYDLAEFIKKGEREKDEKIKGALSHIGAVSESAAYAEIGQRTVNLLQISFAEAKVEKKHLKAIRARMYREFPAKPLSAEILKSDLARYLEDAIILGMARQNPKFNLSAFWEERQSLPVEVRCHRPYCPPYGKIKDFDWRIYCG